jgi:hypothetical protein
VSHGISSTALDSVDRSTQILDVADEFLHAVGYLLAVVNAVKSHVVNFGLEA